MKCLSDRPPDSGHRNACLIRLLVVFAASFSRFNDFFLPGWWFLSLCPDNLLHHHCYNHRLRVQPHSERDTTSLTPLAVDAVKWVTTSKSLPALRADTPARRWDSLIGEKKPRVAEPLELAACDTWKPWPENSRTDSGRELKQRSRLLKAARHLFLIFLHDIVELSLHHSCS